MSVGASVLIYGHDPFLLATRRQVLRQAGFRVVVISRIDEVELVRQATVQVFVICHTISPQNQQEAVAVALAADPAIRTVVMTAYAPEFAVGPGSRFISPFEGPASLIRQVHKAAQDHGSDTAPSFSAATSDPHLAEC